MKRSPRSSQCVRETLGGANETIRIWHLANCDHNALASGKTPGKRMCPDVIKHLGIDRLRSTA